MKRLVPNAAAPLTEDELARLADDVRSLPMFRSSTTVGYLEWDWVHRPAVLSLIAALRATPVADTAGIDAAVSEARRAIKLRYAEDESEDPGYALDLILDAVELLAAALRTPKPEGEQP